MKPRYKLPKSRGYPPRPECDIQPKWVRPEPTANEIMMSILPLIWFLVIFSICLMLTVRADPPAHKAAEAARVIKARAERAQYQRQHPDPTIGQMASQAAATARAYLDDLAKNHGE